MLRVDQWWIGLIRVDGHFMWKNDNSSVTYTDWDIGQPNGGPNECVAFANPHQSYKWGDGPCDADHPIYPICESRPTDRPAPIGK
ncbi:hypothetical protein DPMN_068535 [Dreissena polymorpha]|uniref:C-type lectin domain-containing protein n=1 Tax=Dreissena polymorpha TaxID=45954 RepID=A0A9D3Z1T8_DREPO|nr:hypothetical protein DPMN_068535 [Dreissena polymorpha]